VKALGSGKKDQMVLAQLRKEREVLANVQRGTQVGEFVAVCRTDYTQTFSDPWIERFDYQWSEYLFLIKDLLVNPADLSALVFLPADMSEVYYVVVPAQSPDIRHLSPRGRQDYELQPGYDEAVRAELYKDYASLPKRSVFHSVDAQVNNGWQQVVEDVIHGRVSKVTLDYEGVQYVYGIPNDKEEAEANAFTAIATRHGAYPMETSLLADDKYDIVPTVPEGRTARVTVREFAADPRQKAPFGQLSFQKTELERGSVPQGLPLVHHHISLGNDLTPNQSFIEYVKQTYVQLSRTSPRVRILGYS
jgi:hypothetical protein